MVEQEAGLVEAIGRKEEYEAGFRGLLTDLELAEDLREQAEARADDLQAAALMPPPPPPPPPPPAGDETASQQPTTIGSRAAAIEQQVLGLRDETEALRAELATAVAGKAAAEGQLAAGRRLAEAAGDRVAEVDRTGPAELRQLMAELREGLGARELEAAAERAAERAVRAGQMRNVEQDLATAESNVGWLRAELIASQTQCRAAETVAAAAEERRTRGELAVKAEVALHGELAGSAASVLRLELDRLEAEQAELAAKHHARWRHTALTTFAALPVAKRSVACHPSLATLAAQTRDGPTPAQLHALQTETRLWSRRRKNGSRRWSPDMPPFSRALRGYR